MNDENKDKTAQPDGVNVTAAEPVAAPVVEATVENAVEILQRGGLVAFPTETVYGLGADAMNAAAMQRLYKVKGRPKAHPVIVHIARRDQLAEWASEVTPIAEKLAEAFWPGPLTLIVKRAEKVSDLVTGGQDTVGVRVPSHKLARQLLEAFGGGIAAPSANRFGKVSPTTADHVRADLGADVNLVLDGGACEVGIESTIVDVTGDVPVILRPGKINAADIERVLGVAPVVPAPATVAVAATAATASEGAVTSSTEAAESTDAATTPDTEATPAAAPATAPATAPAVTPRVPGSLAAHYAPRAKLRLVTRREIIDTLITNKGRRIAVLALEVSVPRHSPALVAVAPAASVPYAKALYANLRTLDATGCDLILAELPPDMPSWAGVRDRLMRAASPEEPVKKKITKSKKAAEQDPFAEDGAAKDSPEPAPVADASPDAAPPEVMPPDAAPPDTAPANTAP